MSRSQFGPKRLAQVSTIGTDPLRRAWWWSPSASAAAWPPGLGAAARRTARLATACQPATARRSLAWHARATDSADRATQSSHSADAPQPHCGRRGRDAAMRANTPRGSEHCGAWSTGAVGAAPAPATSLTCRPMPCVPCARGRVCPEQAASQA